MTFSPLARSQYADRHQGNTPQISTADLFFSSHAFIISSLTLLQVFHYRENTNKSHKYSKFHHSGSEEEHERLIPTPLDLQVLHSKKLEKDVTKPSRICTLILWAIVGAALGSGIYIWINGGKGGRVEWLDWLYFISSIKLFISLIKYIPQIILNWRVKSVEGMAIGQIITVRPVHVDLHWLLSSAIPVLSPCTVADRGTDIAGPDWISPVIRPAGGLVNIHRS